MAATTALLALARVIRSGPPSRGLKIPTWTWKYQTGPTKILTKIPILVISESIKKKIEIWKPCNNKSWHGMMVSFRLSILCFSKYLMIGGRCYLKQSTSPALQGVTARSRVKISKYFAMQQIRQSWTESEGYIINCFAIFLAAVSDVYLSSRRGLDQNDSIIVCNHKQTQKLHSNVYHEFKTMQRQRIA